MCMICTGLQRYSQPNSHRNQAIDLLTNTNQFSRLIQLNPPENQAGKHEKSIAMSKALRLEGSNTTE